MPNIVSKKYAYADDLANLHDDGHWQAVEVVLGKDEATTSKYIQTWTLKFSQGRI